MQALDIFGEPIEIACKICSECLESKPAYEFANDTTYSRSKCKKCRKKAKDQLDILKKFHPKPDIRTYCCPCCNDSIDDMKKKGYVEWRQDFVLHHCHKTGRFIAWVCHLCNTGISNLKDDPNVMKNAVALYENEEVRYDSRWID